MNKYISTVRFMRLPKRQPESASERNLKIPHPSSKYNNAA